MNYHHITRFAGLLGGLALLACSGDDDPQPIYNGGTGASAGSGGGTAGSGGGTAGSGGGTAGSGGGTAGSGGGTAGSGGGTAGSGGGTAGSGGGTAGSGGGTGGQAGDLLHFDPFEYVVDRDDGTTCDLFQTEGHWSGAKSIQCTGSHNGYVYTADAIPGHTEGFPGQGSSRVLVIEALPGSLDAQTDFYLQYGASDAPENTIPGNVWFQFWIFVNHAGGQMSQIDGRNKFIYPCNSSYPCTGANQKWLLGAGNYTYAPHFESPSGDPSNGDMWLQNSANTEAAEIINPGIADWDRWKIGQTDISEHMAANRWTLVKIHIDTSTTDGSYESWMRPQGGAWTKVAEWIDGNGGFEWNIQPQYVGGHRVFRMPTTVGEAPVDRPRYDAWIYMDDFAMATSESALPVY